MAMSGSSLKARIKAKVEGKVGQTLDEGAYSLLAEICDAIIEEIKANAVVTVASGISVATAGGATAQTGSTTSTGTGTIA